MPTTGATTTAHPQDEAAGRKPPGARKKILVLTLAVLLVAGGASWFVLRPAPEPAEPEPGEVLALEAIQVNLQGGHYLRVGIALQMSIEVTEELDGSKALDALIDIYSGEKLERIAEPQRREELREVLVETVAELYEDDVLDVYITEFVTQ